MEWQDIINKARIIKEDFDRSYKCLNIDRPTKEETTKTHFEILLNCLEKVRVLFNVHYNKFTVPHKTEADAFFLDLKTKIFKVQLEA